MSGDFPNTFIVWFQGFVHLPVDIAIEGIVEPMGFHIRLKDIADVCHGSDRRFEIRVEAQPDSPVDGRSQPRGFIYVGAGRWQAKYVCR